ncbi:MAG: SRPBCC domain-containing protein [Phycisphaerales bacterium]
MAEIAPFVTSVDIRAPIGRVWEEITRSGMCRPMFGTVYKRDLKPGGAFRYSSADDKRTFVYGEIVEVEPPRKFVHTFRFTMKGDPPTLVTWTLEEKGSGMTRVTVRHEGFIGETLTKKRVTVGWTKILPLFKSTIEKGDVPAKTKLGQVLMGAMSFMLPKSTLTSGLESKYQRVG